MNLHRLFPVLLLAASFLVPSRALASKRPIDVEKLMSQMTEYVYRNELPVARLGVEVQQGKRSPQEASEAVMTALERLWTSSEHSWQPLSYHAFVQRAAWAAVQGNFPVDNA